MTSLRLKGSGVSCPSAKLRTGIALAETRSPNFECRSKRRGQSKTKSIIYTCCLLHIIKSLRWLWTRPFHLQVRLPSNFDIFIGYIYYQNQGIEKTKHIILIKIHHENLSGSNSLQRAPCHQLLAINEDLSNKYFIFST